MVSINKPIKIGQNSLIAGYIPNRHSGESRSLLSIVDSGFRQNDVWGVTAIREFCPLSPSATSAVISTNFHAIIPLLNLKEKHYALSN